MKVVHITPTYFDDSSIIGGGERYPMELASLMADVVDTTLVSFHQNATRILKVILSLRFIQLNILYMVISLIL